MTVRVAMFLPSLVGGGAERVMLNLATAFVDQGMEVDLVLARAEGQYLHDVPTNVRIIDLRATRVLLCLPNLVGYLRREHPQVVLAALDHANVIAIIAAKLARRSVPVIATIHNMPMGASGHAETLRARLTPLLTRTVYPLADAIVAVSEGVARNLLRSKGIAKRGVHVIYNPVVSHEMLVKAQEPVQFKWYEGIDDVPVIIGVGRLTAEKDFETLIRAFSLVRKNRTVRLLIIGEGEERQRLETLVQELGLRDEVALPGFVENPYSYISRSRLFVLSSRSEGLPTALVEAAALGVPVISTDCPSGPAEVLRGSEQYLVPVGDTSALAHAIEATLDSTQRQRIDTHAFTVKCSAQRYRELLEALL